MRAFLEAGSSDEEIVGDEEDDDEERVITQSDHDSTSEQEGSDSENEISSETDGDDSDDEEFFYGKNRAIKWQKTPVVSKFAKTPSKNIIKILPRPSQCAMNITNECDAFQKFFTNKMIDEIVLNTNNFIRSQQPNYSRERDAKLITNNELLALFGLLFLSGVKKANHTNFQELWMADGTGLDIFAACMSYNRFLFILSKIRFDDKETRVERQKSDKLAAVRKIFTEFVYNCKRNYCHSEFLTIDEMLVPFRGRCSFIQYIPSKPAKYGLKLFALCDAKMYYTSNIEIYCGQQPDGPYKVSNSPHDIVIRLLEHVERKNRNVTCDNWYTSCPLAMELLQKNITLVGTLRKNKADIPIEFQPSKTRAINSAVFGFQKNLTIVSFAPKKNKAVILISTKHDTPFINPNTQKPEIIHFYNETKGGVDTVDQLCGNYSVSRRTNRWPLCIIFHLLNIAGVNAQILYNGTHPDNPAKNRRTFLKSMAMLLMEKHLAERSKLKTLPTRIKLLLTKYSQTEENVPPTEPPQKIRSRCVLCGRAKNRVTTMRCTSCQNFVCKEHTTAVIKCQTCLNLGQEEESEEDAF